ncbi:helix-turn-helix domain-containing protein [Microbacter margulisiae]|uniref:Transcriptional regulator with XRE-family HTH domain n=1 Tax=Microbacter margulisiae TaxID=1350067 RepID=A0A7W5DNL6_9PORP|nr:helix-turn-helix transcriptional regulator [Microbacter margulisiae]MBB3186127.1 transcriptional regulator with XRE-family HTH domain [Microbacter margulisiae]
MDILQKINSIRTQKGISQEIIAEAINRDISAVSNILSGKRELRVSELAKIANVFNMSIIDLFLWEDPQEKEQVNYVSEESSIYIKKENDRILRNYIKLLEEKVDALEKELSQCK